MNIKHRSINVSSGISAFVGFVAANRHLDAIQAEMTRANSLKIKLGMMDSLYSVTFTDYLYLLVPFLGVTLIGMLGTSTLSYLLGIGFKPWHKEQKSKA